jgi:hypothetical protein
MDKCFSPSARASRTLSRCLAKKTLCCGKVGRIFVVVIVILLLNYDDDEFECQIYGRFKLTVIAGRNRRVAYPINNNKHCNNVRSLDPEADPSCGSSHPAGRV